MKALAIAAGIVAVLLALPAEAQFAKVEDAVKYRQSALTVMGRHFGLIGAALKGDIPYKAEEVAKNADIVAFMSHLPWPAFVAGSDTDKSKAKAEIWSEADKFRQLTETLQTRTADLADIAKAGDQAAVKAAFGKVGETCKECHDHFRAK